MTQVVREIENQRSNLFELGNEFLDQLNEMACFVLHIFG